MSTPDSDSPYTIGISSEDNKSPKSVFGSLFRYLQIALLVVAVCFVIFVGTMYVLVFLVGSGR